MLKMKNHCPAYLDGILITKSFVRDTRGSADLFILKNYDSSEQKFDKNSIASKLVNNWNELPASLRHLEDFDKFLQNLKTFYFNNWLIEKGLASA